MLNIHEQRRGCIAKDVEEEENESGKKLKTSCDSANEKFEPLHETELQEMTPTKPTIQIYAPHVVFLLSPPPLLLTAT